MPLTEERLEELYRGTLRLVARRGYESITMDQVAAATQSSKATLYRQWNGKAGLVAQALRSVSLPAHEPADTGTLRGDLRAMVDRREEVLAGEGDLVGAILHAVKHDADLRAAVQSQILAAVHARIGTVTARAVARGELAAAAPGLAHLDLLVISPFVLRLALEDETVSALWWHDYVDTVLLPVLLHSPIDPRGV